MQEINELKNLVVQSLESHGVLGQLRAQIRSSVFKIIDMQETQNSKRQNSFFWENPLCQKIYENEFGSLAVELITELLQFYKMDYTLSVFPHESNLKEEVTREKVSKKLGVNPDNDKNIPLLIQVLKTFFNNGNIQEKNLEIKKMEETKQEIKENNVKPLKNEQKDSREIKKEVISKEPDVVLKNKEVKEQPIPQKKEPEFIKENPKEIAIKEIKKQEAGQNNKAQIQPLPMNLRQNPKNFDAIQQQEMEIPKETKTQQPKEKFGGSNEINKEKKALADNQQKLENFEKKIVSKQIAEIPSLPIKHDEKPHQKMYDVPSVMDKRKNEVPEKKKEELSHHYDDENFDEYNEEVNEEIFHEDENVEEMMYRQGGEQMDMHGQQVQESDENFGASQSQGFDILVNSTTLEEYDYFEDVMMP